MDIKKQKQAWHRRYRYHIIAGAAIIALVICAVITLLGPHRSRIDSNLIEIGEVTNADFLEYIDVEGVVHPFRTVKVNSLEAGFVDRIIAEEGAILEEGDTILTLQNPELLRTIIDEEDEYRRQRRLLREQEIENSQKSLNLQQQILDVNYEMSQLDNKLKIAREEYEMGMKSKAEIELAENEYAYHKKKSALQKQNLAHDSTATILRNEMLRGDLERVATKRDRAYSRKENLIVRAPISGQLSYLSVSVGEQVQTGSCIGEIKALNNFKIRASLNEYYVDRIASGLPGTISWQNEQFPLKVSRVVPEIKDRSFDVDLLFTGDCPANLRVGKSYRVQIELGQPEKTVILPGGDFYNATNGKWVYKLVDGGNRAVKTKIVLGRKNPNQHEVISGLKPGDKVIINGYDLFNNSDEIILNNL